MAKNDPRDMTDDELAQMRATKSVDTWEYHAATAERDRRQLRSMQRSARAAAVSAAGSMIAAAIAAYAAFVLRC